MSHLLARSQAAPVRLHPESLKHLKRGHFWVTKDRFTKDFPKSACWLKARGKEGEWLLLHDPSHPKIKARLWGRSPVGVGKEEIKARLTKAFKKRKEANIFAKRDNFFLAFGEADRLPGLFVLAFGDLLVVQNYCGAWEPARKELANLIDSVFEELFHKKVRAFLWQWRSHGRKEGCDVLKGELKERRVGPFQEDGVRFWLRPFEGHDLAWYTDMASVREALFFERDLKGKKILNLFSYTGAFSLAALKAGAGEVHSVDLSKKYLKWLEENLEANDLLDKDKHHFHREDVSQFLQRFRDSGDKVDLIICDPPPASSDGKRIRSAFSLPQKILPVMQEILVPGGELLLVLNTRQINRAKFERQLQEILQKTPKLAWQKKGPRGLSGDCPVVKNFPEGDYLKLALLRRL